MNCLYRMYVLILHHKLFMFNLIISVRIQTDHIQSSAYSPLRPLSINKPLQPAERLSKKWLLDQDFWEISNMKCLFFRFGWLFYFRQNNRDKYPCRRGLLRDDCPVILQHVTESSRQNHVEINGVYYNSYYLCKWSSQPWFPSLCRCLRHKIPRNFRATCNHEVYAWWPDDINEMAMSDKSGKKAMLFIASKTTSLPVIQEANTWST